ncbi:MAG TPA: flagellar basal body rod protein FlgB [Blastocatellia bacterium]|nr:flagellar basal body rod protein FlgB [Blastocatellia bacterium]
MDAPGLDKITNLLGQFLDVHSRRAQIVAGNLANADTPGYQAQELNFAEYLQQATEQALKPGFMSEPPSQLYTPQVVLQTNHSVGLDGNNVEAGHEMATLSNAGMNYLTGTTMLQSRLRTLRTAIREGR